MATIYSSEALVAGSPPLFSVWDSENANIVSDDFLTKTHAQGPRGGEPFADGDFVPGIPVVFPDDDPFYQSVEELWDDISGTAWSANQSRNFVRRFRVLLQDGLNHVGPVVACSCPGIPLPWSPYKPLRKGEWDSNAVCVNLSASVENRDDYRAWVVVAQYSTEVPAHGPTLGRTGLGNATIGNQRSPWEEPVSVESDVETETVYPTADLDGKSFNNAADQPFTPPFSHPTGYRSYTVTRNERVIDFENRVEDYIYVVNSTPFKGYPAGYVLCTGGRGTKLWRGMTPYYRVVYKLLCKKRTALPGGGNQTFTPGWQPRILNAGMFQRPGLFGGGLLGDTELIPIMKMGHHVNQPVLLDENGFEQTEKFAVDYEVVALRGKLKPTWLDFKAFRAVELNDLLSF